MQNHISCYLICTLFIAFLFSSCSTIRDENSLKKDAAILREEIVRELSEITTLQDAKAKAETLEKLFIHLACLMIEVDEYQEKWKVEWEMSDEEKLSSSLIFQQMERLLSVPGVQEVVEKAQERGFRRVENYYHMKWRKGEGVSS